MNYFWKIWFAELNPSFQHDLTLLFNMTHRNWNLLFKMTQRNWTHFLVWLKEYFSFQKLSDSKNKLIFFFFENIKELNLFNLFFQHDSKNWTFFNMTRRIEHFWMRLEELNTFECDSKELNFFFQYDSKNWFLTMIQRIVFFNMTQRIEPFLHDSKNWTFFRTVWIKGLNLLLEICLKELNFFFFWKKHDSKIFFWKKSFKL